MVTVQELDQKALALYVVLRRLCIMSSEELNSISKPEWRKIILEYDNTLELYKSVLPLEDI